MCKWCFWIIQNWLNYVLCLPCFRCIYRKLYRLFMRMIRTLKDLYNRITNCFLRYLRSTDTGRSRYKYSQLRNVNDVESNPINRRELNEIHSGIETNERIHQLESELKFLQLECDRLQIENSGIKGEKEDALRRLSEVMSSNLRDNNPNIVDLSDEYRPTKLAEMSSELYDNEWTDAFTFLEKKLPTQLDGACDDKIITKILLEIFMGVYEVCKNKQESEWKEVVANIIGSSAIAVKEDLKYLKDLRKKYALERYREVHSTCLEKLQHSTLFDQSFLDNRSLLDYVNGCVKLCWFSQFQDPPIVFLFPNFRGPSFDTVSTTTISKNGGFSPSKETLSPNENELFQSTIISESGAENYGQNVTEFDKNLYKEYTKSGSYIDYVVWPVMLLHEDGPILSKGVAQGCK